MEEVHEDPWNINILELEGQREVGGPSVKILDISQLMSTKHMNIGSEAEPKFTNISDYWDEEIVNKVAELLDEYQDLFPTEFSDLKEIVGDLGVMKINLKPYVKLVKQCPYRLKPKYKEMVWEELDKILAAKIIKPVEESKWFSPMVVQEKKTKSDNKICIDLKKLNDACVHGPFPASFTDEFLKNFDGHKPYSFTDGFSRYH